MAKLDSLQHSIEDESKVKWSTSQENSLSSDFPFELSSETPEEFAYRTYLQFLWLPEVIMPLHQLVPSLRRISASSSSDTHPLHGLLDDILLTVPTVTHKYRKELVNILVNGEGAGEMEEAMMWFAVTHEKADIHEPWLDDGWREKWLDRLERREVQIQVLLYFLKLSLPAPSKAKGRRKRSSSQEITTEEYAESFLDKLSMWQLLNTVQSTKRDKADGRDWMQIFCEDIVEPEFNMLVPDLCQLLRSKVFPHSPFSDTESNASTTRASSPISPPAADAPSMAGSSKGSAQVAKSLSRAPSMTSSRRPSPKASARELSRARSRSLSVSLAQEREQSAAAPAKRRVVTREISMSRVFKAKPKPTALAKTTTAATDASQVETAKGKDIGVTLVEDTPVKPRMASLSQTVTSSSQSQQSRLIFPPANSIQGGLFGGRISSAMSNTTGTDDDDAWQISSSPDIMLLGSPSKAEDDEDVDMDLHPVTPSRPSRRKKKVHSKR